MSTRIYDEVRPSWIGVAINAASPREFYESYFSAKDGGHEDGHVSCSVEENEESSQGETSVLAWPILTRVHPRRNLRADIARFKFKTNFSASKGCPLSYHHFTLPSAFAFVAYREERPLPSYLALPRPQPPRLSLLRDLLRLRLRLRLLYEL